MLKMEVNTMESLNTHNFDLSALLKIEAINIRLAVRNNFSLRIDEYYNLLSKFIHYAPNIIETLNRITALEGNGLDFLTLAGAGDMLISIGCNKFSTAIDDIIKAGKMGHNEFAASCAKKLSGEFSTLLSNVKNARKKQESDTTEGEYPVTKFKSLSLKLILEQLEQEEAKRKMRVLAIDDSPVMLKTISSILGEDYAVSCMTNPAMLEKFLEQITPELFLLDYKMPELNGFDLVPIIRKFDIHKKTPIVFLTAEGTSDHVSTAFTIGACDFIVKPFQANILREKVAKHIIKKNLLKRKAA
jgi:CheY-like chemotaxis protein